MICLTGKYSPLLVVTLSERRERTNKTKIWSKHSLEYSSRERSLTNDQ